MIKEVEYNPIYADFLKSEKRYAVLVGGAGSGKSIVTAQKTLLRICNEEKHRIICFRKVAATLRRSVYQLFRDLIYEYGLDDQFKINKSEFSFTHLPSGNEILLSGLDEPEKIKSIAGITSVWIEEATDLTEQDFAQVELRVRGETKNYKQFILTFNPIDEDHWLKTRFFDKQDNKAYCLKTTYLDNEFLDDDYIDHLTTTVKSNENLYKIYVLGEWGRVTFGGEFYKQFKFSKHVGEFNYDPELPLHVSFDFNVNPYMSLLISQINDKDIYFIDEIALKHPLNTTKDLCKEFARKYSTAKDKGLFIYGDASGKHQDTRSEKGYNDYKIITQQLAEFKPLMRVADKNPNVVPRGNFINTVLDQNFEDISINISTNCKLFIKDLQYVKEASDGTKKKETAKDPDTNVVSQKLGHFSDCGDYLLCEAFKKEFTYYNTGKKKLTYTLGFRKSTKRY